MSLILVASLVGFSAVSIEFAQDEDFGASSAVDPKPIAFKKSRRVGRLVSVKSNSSFPAIRKQILSINEFDGFHANIANNSSSVSSNGNRELSPMVSILYRGMAASTCKRSAWKESYWPNPVDPPN